MIENIKYRGIEMLNLLAIMGIGGFTVVCIGFLFLTVKDVLRKRQLVKA